MRPILQIVSVIKNGFIHNVVKSKSMEVYMFKLNDAILEGVIGGRRSISHNKINNKNYSKIIANHNRVSDDSSFSITVIQQIGDVTLAI